MTEQNTNVVNEEMNAPTTEIVTSDYVAAEQFSPAMFEEPAQALFSTIQVTDRATGVKLYNAINASEESLSDHLGEVLTITDMIAHPITLEDEVTKEPVKAVRVVLVDENGTGYHAVSEGVVSALQKICAVVGQGPWTSEPLKVSPVEVKTRKGFKTLTLRLQA